MNKRAIQYNKRHRSRKLPDLDKNDMVWIRDRGEMGKVRTPVVEPKSFLVKTTEELLKRNRNLLTKLPSSPTAEHTETKGKEEREDKKANIDVRRSSRQGRPPKKLQDYIRY
ncbi:hypothetical protein QE152_g38475 [Popillia japonica]|uniref:Uncharacterized protein n=1 Tax=Popillia japonica TaxID=7064 RepID=A0AAW1HX11_POPJA